MLIKQMLNVHIMTSPADNLTHNNTTHDDTNIQQDLKLAWQLKQILTYPGWDHTVHSLSIPITSSESLPNAPDRNSYFDAPSK